MLLLDMPAGRTAERLYAARVVLGEFLGLEFQPRESPPGEWVLRVPGRPEALRMPDVFFRNALDAWLQPGSLPHDDPTRVAPAGLPRAFAAAPAAATPDGVDFDVLGAAFFMLTRYEECVSGARDHFDRFPSRALCLADSVDLADPFIDRAVEVLAARIEAAWPGLRCRRGRFDLRITHDVDALRNRGRRWRDVVAGCGADVLRRREPALAARRLGAALRPPAAELDPGDPYNSFDFLMDVSEKLGVQSHFYFVPEPRVPEHDPDYTLEQADVQGLLARIGARGHRIGLHAGFGAAFEEGRVAREFELLRRAAEKAGVRQQEWGGRHHYLRWRPDASWGQWDAAGLDYDSSVGYAEAAGFRCGTGRSFPVWDLGQAAPLRLRERPLILMESTLFAHQGLQENAALVAARKLIAACRHHGGTLVLLWHNHNLLTRSSRQLYRTMLAEACAG